MSWRPHEGHELRALQAVPDKPAPRTTRAQDSALFHGALLEINRLGAEIAKLRYENARLRLLHGIKDDAQSERTLDLRGEFTRGDLDMDDTEPSAA